ncbi:hypothetical protein F441_10081 [Phytophthora nicotianae CJ01A1]|uniref:Uncharacterized protein n=3 Tax=Phytophthora nicotianae TaxID=4792 RepID=W2R7Q5_PHYN3|nr:hypothetical protein PPTG_21083 [Phytophthora nicotianae INRA-310]ETL91729.1 hypothetical protein L917_09751 [Phytophthora nicotianae]ETM45020.1 hypothetical protein L914_09804 [Phytophthora nicotianae]ETN21433.1 hypothetical protein PPTG_21083 [Phytophthora nicotianae INRA-310]ETP15027.1 hypothetical protein F441_10081 [Phytophthora nicotianae CJ01A1]
MWKISVEVVFEYSDYGSFEAKMAFGKRELKYRNEMGQKPSRRSNARSVVRVKTVDAHDGSAGDFLPKPTHKRHVLLAPTVSVVRDGEASGIMLNL